MITVCYFAALRERLDIEREQLPYSEFLIDINALVAELAARGGVFADAFADTAGLCVARNHEMTNFDAPIADGDEIAFFPPVTGG